MQSRWKVQVYETGKGEKPVEEFIKSLDEKAQTKIGRTLDHLEEFGTALGTPHMKKVVGTDLWELRILGSDSIRIFYVTVAGKIFLLLHGFKKKTQKTPRKEIALAEKRVIEYQTRQSSS